MGNGLYTWYVNASDRINVNVSEIRDLRIDNVKPSIALDNPINGYNTSLTYINFNWTVADSNLSTICNLTLDGVFNVSNIAVQNNTMANRTVTNIPDGLHYWGMNCTDGLNANISEMRYFTIDTIKPSITLLLPNNSASQTEGYVNFTYNVTDVNIISSCILEFDSMNVSDYSIDKSQSVLSFYPNKGVGTYNWRVYCNDSANNWNVSEQRSITLTATAGTTALVSGSVGGIMDVAVLGSITAEVPKVWDTDSEVTIKNILVKDASGNPFDPEVVTLLFQPFSKFRTISMTRLAKGEYEAKVKPTTDVVVYSNYTVKVIAKTQFKDVSADYTFAVERKTSEGTGDALTNFGTGIKDTITESKTYEFLKNAWSNADKVKLVWALGISSGIFFFSIMFYFAVRRKK